MRLFQLIALTASLLLLGAHAASARNEISMNPSNGQFICQDGHDCEWIKRNIRTDSDRTCAPSPESVETHIKSLVQTGMSRPLLIQGSQLHSQVVHGPYGYTVFAAQNTLIIEVKLHFKNWSKLSSDERRSTESLLGYAAKYWTRKNPYSFPIEFRFSVTTERQYAHLKDLKMVKGGRMLYFMKWAVDKSSTQYAHEIGHALGLADEYNQILILAPGNGNRGCDASTIMCKSAWFPTIPKYYYYLFLRRVTCALT